MKLFCLMSDKEKGSLRDGFIFYDEGWNARVLNEPFDENSSLDWKDGWKDCDDSSEKDRAILE